MRRTRRSPERRTVHGDTVDRDPDPEQADVLIQCYRKVAHTAPDWECWRTPDGRCVYVSPSCERITGYAPETFLTDPRFHLSLVHPDDRLRVADHLCENDGSGECSPLQFRIVRRDGAIRWISHTCHVVRDSNEDCLGLRVVHRDITAQKEAETALSGQEGLFRELAENLAEVLWIVTPDWNEVLYVSPAYETLWGRTCADLYAHPRAWLEAVLTEDRPALLSSIERVAREGLPGLECTEYRVRRPDGSVRAVRARGFGVLDGEGRVCRIVGIAEDVTDQKQIESALRKGKEEYETLARNLPGMVYRIHLQNGCRMQFYNDLVEPMTGFPADELISDETCSIIPHIVPEDQPRVAETVEAAVRTGEPFEIRYRLRHRNGSIRCFSEQGRAIADEKGRPLYIDGVIFDVTDRHQQQERLREREAQLQAFFDSNAVLMSIMALAEENLIYVRPNETMAAFYGMTARELTGKSCREIGVTEDVIAFWLERFREIRRTGRPMTLEYEFPSDGRQRWYHGTISPISPHSSPFPLFALATVEITERRRAELALKESEARFREVLESSLDVSYRRNLQTDKYDYFSPVFQGIAGYTPEEMSGLDTKATLALIHPEDRSAVIEELEKALESGAGFVEYRFRSKGGEYRWLGDKIRVVRDSKGVPLYRVGVVRDITHRKQVEHALIQAKEELEERVRRRTVELEVRADQLARLTSELTTAEQRERRRMAQVIHDHLQQLLVGAKFGLDVLSRRIDEEQLSTLKQVEKLLNESINTARSLTAELSPPILHEAGLQAALEWLVRWMREKYGLIVEFVSDDKDAAEREDLRILLFQAVREALFNVVKHAKVTHAHVTLTHPDSNHVQVVIRDEGAGFDRQDISFESGQAAGGFGLVSIRERLALLGGTLELESAVQRGTVLTMTAPIAPPRKVTLGDRSRQRPPEERTDASGPARKPSPEQGPIRVLLVDDHVVMRQGLSMLLGDESDLAVIGEASDGTEAIAAARELRPDVILMDFGMPHMNGVEATRIIHKEFPEIRIIALSMYEEADRATAMLEAGATAYLSKSGRSEMLLQAIRETRTG